MNHIEVLLQIPELSLEPLRAGRAPIVTEPVVDEDSWDPTGEMTREPRQQITARQVAVA
jgi:hypothetical protein